MPWKAFPFEDPRIDHLSHMYSISGIPSLVIVGPDGKVITEHGRERVSRDPYGSDFPWYPSAHRQQQCEKALSDYKMTLGTVLGSGTFRGGGSSSSGAGGAGGGVSGGAGGGEARTIQVRDGRKYTVGEVATFKQRQTTLTGRVVSNTPNPKVTAPDAATIVLDTSLNNNNINNNAAAGGGGGGTPLAGGGGGGGTGAAAGAAGPGAASGGGDASPQRSAAALAAERRAAGMASPSTSGGTGSSAGSDATASTLRSSSGSGTGSGDSSFQSGDQLLSAPSPAPVPLGPPPTEAAPVPGTRRFCSPSALFTVCGAVWLAQRVWRELVLMHVGGALLQARAARRLQAEPEVEQAATTHESHSS